VTLGELIVLALVLGTEYSAWPVLLFTDVRMT
jgi:hypothetical protein